MIDPIEMARELIDIPSISGDENAVADLLERRLGMLGFETERLEVDQNRFNLLARTAAQPAVVYSTHIDTVPPFFASSEDDQFVYGRGACDTKGIIAAMLAAGEQLLAGGVDSIGFLFVVSEETDSIGAKRANESLSNLGSRFLINGEPTESKFVAATKGALTCMLRFEGIAAHSAYPERGSSAISKLARAIRAIETTSWPENDRLGKTTVNVGVVRGGVKPNVIAAEAEAELIFRTSEHPDRIRERLESLIAPFDGTISKFHGNPPVFMHVPGGETPVVVAFNTDVAHLTNLGKPVLFGPGSILDAHTDAEKISKRDLLSAVATYRDLGIRLIESR